MSRTASEPTSPPHRIAIIVGLGAEARLIRASQRRLPADRRALVSVAGASAERAEALAKAAVAAGVRGLVSFGVAGGLAPGLMPGALVLATQVVTSAGGSLRADEAWRGRLTERLRGTLRPVAAPLAGSLIAVVEPAAKAALAYETGAVAVDMESAAVARVARAAGLPFLVVRAVGDPARRRLPAAALAALGADGRLRPFAVLAALARNPAEFRPLLQVARDTRQALRTLGHVARLGGADLAFA
jgi:adenosylhomocysteine nucleosidase